jgi:hypothetical protein
MRKIDIPNDFSVSDERNTLSTLFTCSNLELKLKLYPWKTKNKSWTQRNISTLSCELNTRVLASAHFTIGLPRMEGVAIRAICDAASCRESRIFDYSFLLEYSKEVPTVGIISLQPVQGT